MKAQFNQRLDDQKREVQLIEETIVMTKKGYAQSLKELENISEEIHEKRESLAAAASALGKRGEGVGAEDPDKVGEDGERVKERERAKNIHNFQLLL